MLSTPTFHPFLSHFPIALVAVSLILVFRKTNQESEAIGAMALNLSFGLLAAILASLSGMLSADLGQLETTRFEGHQGYAFLSVLLIGASTVFAYTKPRTRQAYLCYFLSFMALLLAQYTGYQLVFQFKG